MFQTSLVRMILPYSVHGQLHACTYSPSKPLHSRSDILGWESGVHEAWKWQESLQDKKNIEKTNLFQKQSICRIITLFYGSVDIATTVPFVQHEPDRKQTWTSETGPAEPDQYRLVQPHWYYLTGICAIT